MRDFNQYKDFKDNDFITDPWFQDWIADPDGDRNIFWNSFFENYPLQREAGEKARSFLKKIVFAEEFPDESSIRKALAVHLENINKTADNKVVAIKKRFRIKRIVGIAATAGSIILIVSALFIYSNKSKPASINTGYGEIRQVVLPDSSLVVLNAHSTIKFADSQGKSKSRQVWLEGEAFFNVKHLNTDTNNISQYERFIVHSGDMKVEVLGTSFDIRRRRQKTVVVLQTGSIKISFNNATGKAIIMQPGQMLVYDSDTKSITNTLTSPENFTAWKGKKLLLDNPSAREIIQYLEDNFGKHIVLEDPAMGDRKIEGAILLTNLEDALFVLSTVLNAEIINKENTIIIRPR